MKGDPYDELDSRQMIYAGSKIAGSVLEELFGIKQNHDNYVWLKLSLRNLIEMNGYFVTERGCPDGGMRILSSQEMAGHATRKLDKNKNSNQKIALILKAHDISGLTDEEQRKHRATQMKAARCSALMAMELLKEEIL